MANDKMEKMSKSDVGEHWNCDLDHAIFHQWESDLQYFVYNKRIHLYTILQVNNLNREHNTFY